MLDALKRRSSWPSSLMTGLVGWTSFCIIVSLALGYSGSPGTPLALAVLGAVAQVLVLRLGFFLLRMDRGVWVGFLWGSLTGGAVILAATRFFDPLREHPWIWLANGVYIGFAVGGFLSYFYRDDREIEAAAPQAGPTRSYGRDAHWLEPFAFGAVSYLVAFMPRSISLTVYILIVGAMSGVLAAGASHFSPDRWKESPVMIALILALGSAIGVASSLLFRQFASQLLASYLVLGGAAGFLTYLITFLRGRSLARREAAS